MADIGYPLDNFGTNPKNKVEEKRTLTSKVLDGRTFMVPKAAPFYSKDVVVKSGGKTLVEGVDYQIILDSKELTHAMSLRVAGGILFHKLSINTVVDVTVQTVGGNFNLPINNTVEDMAKAMDNVLYVTWSMITGTPIGLPTWTHEQTFETTAGYNEYISALHNLANVILRLNPEGGGGGGDGGVAQALLNHINAKSAHTKAQVGLSEINNWKPAQNSDFDASPVANDKYVTPRMVHYGFTLWVGKDIEDINSRLDDIDNVLETQGQDWGKLLNEMAELRNALDVVNKNYQQMVQAVNSYTIQLEQLNNQYKTITENQARWEQKLDELTKLVEQYEQAYKDVVEAQDALLAEFQTVKDKHDETIAKLTLIEEKVDTNKKNIEYIMLHAVTPRNKVVTAGSYNFKIRPKEVFEFVIVGGGGGCGDFVTEAPNMGSIIMGEHGGTTAIHCLTNLTNGEPTPNKPIIALAEGGFGGGSSYGSRDNKVTIHGNGGRGGVFQHVMENIELIEASNGEGGFKGFGETYDAGKTSNQDTGYDYFGTMWGRGALTAEAVGQGGEGAKVAFTFTNNFDFDLDMMVVVGAVGRSYTASKTNAVGGVAIIKRIIKQG